MNHFIAITITEYQLYNKNETECFYFAIIGDKRIKRELDPLKGKLLMWKLVKMGATKRLRMNPYSNKICELRVELRY